MVDQSTNYDDVKQYRLSPEREQELINSAGECVFIWANKAGHPLGVITAYVPVDGKIWMTATRERVRIKAIARDGRSSCVFTSKGTHMGGGKTVTLKGHTVIHEEDETKQWFYQLLAKGMSMRPDDGNEFTKNLNPDLFVKFLDTPERVVLEFTPEMSIPFDGDKMAQGTAAAYAQFAQEEELMLRIGISVTSSYTVADPREGAASMIARAKAAREADLDTLFVGDHHVTPFPYYQNNVILARMLAEWGDKPFGALYLLPLWHPVTLAEQVGTLASLASGRFIMQCGLGDERQGAAMGIDMSKKVGMFLASLRTLRSLWAGEPANEDRYWHIKDAVISPRPVEPVEVWVGAVVDKAIERTAKVGDAWLASPGLTPADAAIVLRRYLEYCDQQGRQPETRAIRRDIYVGESTEEAKRTAAVYIEKGYRGISPDALMFGSVEEVAAQMKELGDAGFTDIIVRNMSKDPAQCLATIERLREVKALLAG